VESPSALISAPVGRALLISNAAAGSVTTPLREEVTAALKADLELEVAQTQRRGHATELAGAAADQDFDAVLVLGGDGTVNEAAHGLVGSSVALGLIPGGSTNVMARSLGIPRDPIAAADFVASALRSGSRRRINVGRLNDRHFLFSAGVGIDAEVVRRVEAEPEKKRRLGEWLWLSNVLKVAVTEYVGAEPSMTARCSSGTGTRVLLLLCANGSPYTYFKHGPVNVLPEARLAGGLDFLGLTRLHPLMVPRLAFSLFVGQSHIRWRTSLYCHDVDGCELVVDRAAPAQVDGDYIGNVTRAEFALVPDALTLLA
jgi:diacylglycerol kinase family enzyme